jgi:hypothetical protein
MMSITKTLQLDFTTDTRQYITCLGTEYEIIRSGNLYNMWQDTKEEEICILGGGTRSDVESYIESLYIEFFEEEFPGYELTFNWV